MREVAVVVFSHTQTLSVNKTQCRSDVLVYSSFQSEYKMTGTDPRTHTFHVATSSYRYKDLLDLLTSLAVVL